MYDALTTCEAENSRAEFKILFGKDYEDDLSLQEYLSLIKNVAQEIYRVLRPGGRYIVNIATELCI